MTKPFDSILQSEAEAALDATWESGSFAGHKITDVEEHWCAVSWMLEVAQERGNTDSATELQARLNQIEFYLKKYSND